MGVDAIAIPSSKMVGYQQPRVELILWERHGTISICLGAAGCDGTSPNWSIIHFGMGKWQRCTYDDTVRLSIIHSGRGKRREHIDAVCLRWWADNGGVTAVYWADGAGMAQNINSYACVQQAGKKRHHPPLEDKQYWTTIIRPLYKLQLKSLL
jgi:hypothetical protein